MFVAIVLVVLMVAFVVVGLPALLFDSWYTVQQQTVRIIQRFGKFSRIGRAGFNWKIPLIESVSESFSLKVQQLEIETETKTKDNVFVLLRIAVQYAITSAGDATDSDIIRAYYQLSSPESQLVNYVNDSVRGRIPELGLDDVFSQKDSIADSIKDSLVEKLGKYGYEISRVLLTDISPDKKVQEAMNEINAAARLRAAATEKAEGEKVIVVKKAEAEMESKILQGKGVAGERQAIVEGMQKAIKDMAAATGLTERDVMQYVQFTQYTDMLREVGKIGTTVMMPANPSEIMSALIATRK